MAAKLVAALLGTGLLASDQEHTGELEREAELMTAAARELEERKMHQTIGALDQKYASAEREVGRAIKIAAAIAAAQGDQTKLASLLEQQGMDKEAIGEFLGPLAQRAGAAALKGIGGAASAAGRLKMPTTGTQRLLAASGGAPAPGRLAGNTAKLLHAGGETAASVGVPQGPGVLQRAGGWLQGKGQALQQAASAGAPAAAAKVAPAAAVASAGKPLISAGTKGKLLAGGALLGAGYVGMKGMQAARDFMMAPGGHSHTPIQQNVNEYGYPQY
jgi:hypothetical protein